MTAKSVGQIVDALNRSGCRYLIAGGLAVVAHGFLRYTADIDVILDPDPEATRSAITALERMGFRPRAPVPLHDFADPEKRRAWVRDKGLTVFTVRSDQHPETEVDLFVELPFDFERAHSQALKILIEPGVEAVFVARADLIEMKRRSGRPIDVSDIAELDSEAGGHT
jgi:hypothetical protein